MRRIREPSGNVRPASEWAEYDGRFLLDTHVWIWMLERDTDRASAALLDLLGRAGGAYRLVVCDISFWEVATNVAKGKLTLSVEAPIWLQQAERAPGVTYLPLVAADAAIIAYARLQPAIRICDARR